MGIKSRSTYYFVAALWGAGLSFVSLPLTTRILGPADYGLAALVGTLTGFGSMLATLGFGFIISRRLTDLDDEAQGRLIASLCLTSVVITGAWGLMIGSIYLALRDSISFLGEIPLPHFLIGLAAMMLSPFWAIASEVLTVWGRARSFALGSILQVTAGVAVLLFCLFSLQLGSLSLFIGLLVTNGVATMMAIIVFSRIRLRAPSVPWLRQIAASSRHFLLASGSEQGYVTAERILLSRATGIAELGLYTHSQRYRETVWLGIKAVTRGVWPVTLAEAKDRKSDFVTTGETWSLVHLAIAVAGIGAATLGDFVIAFLTNDKFTSAASYVAFWFILLLVQNSAKPQHAALYVLGESRIAARLSVVANLTGLASLVPLVMIFGAWGAVTAAFVQVLTFRLLVRPLAQRYRPVPFQDQWALVGSIFILVAIAVKVGMGLEATSSVLAFVGLSSSILMMGRRVVARTAQQWRNA